MQTIFNERIDTFEKKNPIFRVKGSEYCQKDCKKIFYEKLIIFINLISLISLIFMASRTDYSQYGKLAIF